MKKEIKRIVFNNQNYSFIEISDSAKKHYGVNSENTFKEIANKINNKSLDPDEQNDLRENLYHLASCSSSEVPKKKYRDTMFKTSPDKGIIYFFHGSQCSLNKYEKYKGK